ncbi:MAG: ferritin family protein [candidate division WOR-3 bacterium]
MKYTAYEVLEMAVQTEKEARHFYESAASAATDERIQALLRFLAAEEERHIRAFETIGRAHRPTPEEQPYKWDEATLYLKAITDSRYFLGGGKALSLVRQTLTPAQVLATALSFEKETLLFYYGLLDTVEPKARTAVAAIIAQEKDHVRRIHELLEAIGTCPTETEGGPCESCQL